MCWDREMWRDWQQRLQGSERRPWGCNKNTLSFLSLGCKRPDLLQSPGTPKSEFFIKARSLQCGFWPRNSQILIRILPWFFLVKFFLLFFVQGKRPEKSPPKNPLQNSPRTLLGKIPLGFLQKPCLDIVQSAKENGIFRTLKMHFWGFRGSGAL